MWVGRSVVQKFALFSVLLFPFFSLSLSPLMPCKPITLFSSLLPSQKKKQKQRSALADVVEPRLVRSGEEDVAVASAGASGSGGPVPQRKVAEKGKPLRRSSSQAHREFLRATAGGSQGKVTAYEALPTCEQAYSQFKAVYPRFSETRILDQLRLQEYSHLEDEELACLDYCGFGLFSHAQQEEVTEEEEGLSSSFALSEISANLWSHALFGSATEGTMEWAIRTRIMEFLNIPDSEYSMVFTASRGATFKLLADAYPWEASGRLVTMYDYESESVGWMEQRAMESGARVCRARFRWPSLRVCSTELKKELEMGSSKKLKTKAKKQQGVDQSQLPSSSHLTVASWLDRVSIQQQQQKDRKKGLFVFPVQSRVSGSKYSYQWMSIAQQNQWHVLLDASALGPKDMDSLGLSLFRPDFITASFYKLFGGDPSGFGCLLIKNSVAQSIQDPSGALVSGMVRITPLPWVFSASSMSEDSELVDTGRMVSSFSGPVPGLDDLDIPSPHHLPDLSENSACEDNYSSACEDMELASLGGLSRSPVLSEDGNDNTFFADAGPSPLGSASCPSVSEEGFSGPLLEEPTHLPISLNHRVRRRDSQPSRSRIKDLCTGLLHLHTGRVGNSGDSIGEDATVIKDGESNFCEDKDKESSLPKHLEPHKMELLDPGRSVFTEAYFSKLQSSRHESGEFGSKEENMPERLVLVLKKVTEEQLALGNGELSLGLQVKEHEKKNFTRKGGEVLHQKSEEDFEDRLVLRGLETIEEIEIEAEYSKLSEQDHVVDARRWVSEANFPKTSVLETKEQEMPLSWNQKDSAICRETEGGFRLLGRRNGDSFSLGKIFSAGSGDDSFPSRSIGSGGHEDLSSERSTGMKSDRERVDVDVVEEEKLLCRSLDHADMLGLNKTSFRLRYLINWLISSLLRLRHPDNDISLVKIYGPQVRYDRGASVAFNVFDRQGKLLHPDLVRMLADQINVSLGLGFLRNIYFRGNFMEAPVPGFLDTNTSGLPNKLANVPSRVEVVTAALGLLSDFKDVYKLWSFMARFLDPDFVARELGHLQSSSSKHYA